MNETSTLNSNLIKVLPDWLGETLPGLPAQLEMAPPNRQERLIPSPPYRQSAVLLLLYSQHNDLRLIFTKRPSTLRHHAGEICFPGGGREGQDANLWSTALRETEEELGIDTHRVTQIGSLTPLYIAPSKNLVHPFVGWLEHLPVLHPSRDEVERVFQVPLSAFFNLANRDTHTWTYQGQQHKAPCFMIQGACIWGATAMMLSELLVILRNHHV